MVMLGDDDDVEPPLTALENYWLVDSEKQPVCFSTLPLRLGDTGDDDIPKFKKRLVLWGIAPPGEKKFKEVVAWKLVLEGKQPEIAVLAADGGWISLVKPKYSYEETIRTILITVQMLHFLRRKPDESEKNLWSHLRKVFDKFDVRPSVDDLRNHRSLIKKFAEKDPALAKSETMRAFLDGGSRRHISEVGADIEVKQPFIADDEDIDEMDTEENNTESDEDEDDDLFDSICAICDNGGDLLCCDGPCMRSFHATEGTGEDSYCVTLGYTEAEVQAMKIFLCENCKHKQHQCYICGVLEPSDGAAAKVFLCNNATCGHFYHPKCVARLLHPNKGNEASELEKQIADGFSFTCPIHWCVKCKGLEDRTQESLQFAVCRRCPKSYHRKCLPREISFEDIDDEDIITRAWELPKRILIYCLDHEIDPDIDTPARDHIKFPEIEKQAGFSKNKGKTLVKKKKRTYDESVLDQPSKEPGKMSDKVHMQGRKQTVKTSSVKVSSDNVGDRPEKKRTRFLKEKMQPEPHMAKDASVSKPKPVEEQEQEMVHLPSLATRKIPLSSFPIVDCETEKRVIELLGKKVSSLTIKDVTRKCSVPSTHVYSGRQTDRIIAQGKLERSVQAVEAALKKLDNGGNVDDAKAVCEPDVLKQLARWHSKIRVYISPFIHGTRYSSFGRHFTKVEKLVEIVDKLHWYVEPGDMIVDFCCGANDFSRLMKDKLDQVQKKCHFKNYDLIQPKNHFCFEKRDWMTVQPNELPHGSQLIMGLNPPFGVKASLANKFIDKALQFKPKLIVLIVPKETKRLDKKKTPYDLIWEDSECLAGKAFYLPGSVDHSDKTVDGWNASAPPLYLWSHPNWTMKHKKVAEDNNHSCIRRVGCHVDEGNLSDLPVKEEAESYDKQKARSGNEDRETVPLHPREDNVSDNLHVKTHAEAASKSNSRSEKERDTTEKAKCNVRGANLRADRLARKQARSKDEKETTGRIAVHVKEAGASDKVPVKKIAEATEQEVSRSAVNEKEHDRYKHRSRKWTPDLLDSLPPEKQVEVAYEETKEMQSRKTNHDNQNGPVHGDGTVAHREESKSAQHNYEQRPAGLSDIKFREGGDSDMSISSQDGRNARSRSRSFSPSVPGKRLSDRAAHCESYMNRPAKEPYDSMVSRPTYQGSYLKRNDEYSDAPKSGPFVSQIDDSTRKNVSSFEELANRDADATVDPYCLQYIGPDDRIYGRQVSEWSPSASETYLTRYGHLGASNSQVNRTTVTTDSQTHPGLHSGTGADSYLQSRYSLGSSGARFGHPASAAPSFGLSSGVNAPRGSVMDKYAYGLSGPSGSQSSVMDRYAPSLDGTNTARTHSFSQQYRFGGGRPPI
ncbi:hypothetical protein EJB05_44712 [Eragrostis curvula]|uniref:Zinc finger PHD-type domain-containing protein n=1 Tax=Eragrostis curvula TaxID=38414 RepID=A0A5J9TIJ7_9POAL|nr:hypothetical protein EJB05_44712 [Eragrostis curvula]